MLTHKQILKVAHFLNETDITGTTIANYPTLRTTQMLPSFLQPSYSYWMETYQGHRIPYYISDLNSPSHLQDREAYIELLASRISIHDIAHSLSLQCRFLGHCKHHWSVAAHSILVYDCIDQYCCSLHTNLHTNRQKTGITDILPLALLHDAHETYISDNIAPYKAFVKKYLEDSLTDVQDTHFVLSGIFDEAINSTFSLTQTHNCRELIHEADLIVRNLEASLLMASKGHDWLVDGQSFTPQLISPHFVPAIIKVMECNPSYIEEKFLKLVNIYI